MFQEKDLESYRQIKAPERLKARIADSVQRTRKRQIRALTGIAAGIVIFCSAGLWQEANDTVLSVNDTTVAKRAVKIESTNRGIATASQGARQENQTTVPLEIDVPKAQVTVSAGTIQQASGEAAVTELQIQGKTILYWTVNADGEETPVCTITTEKKTYRYGVFMDEETFSYAIRQLN